MCLKRVCRIRRVQVCVLEGSVRGWGRFRLPNKVCLDRELTKYQYLQS